MHTIISIQYMQFYYCIVCYRFIICMHAIVCGGVYLEGEREVDFLQASYASTDRKLDKVRIYRVGSG